MNILESRQKEIVILSVQGRLDAEASPRFDEKLFQMLQRGEKNFLIDFSDLEYISSAALRLLLLLAKNTTTSGGKVAIASLHGSVREIFEISGFLKIFSVYASRDEAVASF